MVARVKLCAIAKDEGAYLADWVFHHLHAGFDAVEVWVNATEDPSLRILRRISRSHPEVTGRRADRLLARCLERGDNFQRRAYTRMARQARQDGFTHVAFLDLDEYWLARDGHSGVHDFLPDDPDVNVVSFPWCVDVPDPDREPFAPSLAPPVRVQLERYVKSVARLDGSIREFREHTAWSRQGRRLWVREPFPFEDRRAQGGGSVVPDAFLTERWSELPEAFVLHALNRSPLEYVANLAKGARQTGTEVTVKPNRYADFPTQAPVLEHAPPARAGRAYVRDLRAFHRAVDVQPLVHRSEERMRARATALLDAATRDEGLRVRLRDALDGMPQAVLDGIHPAWDLQLVWWMDSVDVTGHPPEVRGWAFAHPPVAPLELALRDADGVEWTDVAVGRHSRPDVREVYPEAAEDSGFSVRLPDELLADVGGLQLLVRVAGWPAWQARPLSYALAPDPS